MEGEGGIRGRERGKRGRRGEEGEGAGKRKKRDGEGGGRGGVGGRRERGGGGGGGGGEEAYIFEVTSTSSKCANVPQILIHAAWLILSASTTPLQKFLLLLPKSSLAPCSQTNFKRTSSFKLKKGTKLLR